MSWLCPHCNTYAIPGHSCKEGFDKSEIGKLVREKWCNDCIHLSPTEEEQDKMKLKPMHFCNALGKPVFHMRVHPNIVSHPNCPGKEPRL